ncbi:MAG: hypothetical protein KDB22_03295 [Planctomycetales bacterium]|nr:hypothetical protein [Planctomycetales bacterium]
MRNWNCVLLMVFSVIAKHAVGQLEYEKAPIHYASAESHDPVAKLIKRIQQGQVTLAYSAEHGWLPSLLETLDVPVESQTLVFSKTSLQLHKISPRTPRALYFNDDVYVGWCQRGDVIEIAATDPQLGAVFYTLSQHADEPEITRDRGQCLTCHATHRTQGVPGYLVRSIYPDNNGRPRTGTRTYVTDHTTSFENRFGGWYVTGKHGAIQHMGNAIAQDSTRPEWLDRDVGANRSDLHELCDTSRYLRPDSDIVALMVLEHQSQMHNLIARASLETRIARFQDEGINEVLGRPKDTISPSTGRRMDAAAEELVKYMLFANEAELQSPIRSASPFVESFQDSTHSAVKLDSQGRSLRQFDLTKRMFKYPCSYLIYSPAFDGLPILVKQRVQTRLREILYADEAVEGFEHLTASDRRAIVEILADTKPGFLIEQQHEK